MPKKQTAMRAIGVILLIIGALAFVTALINPSPIFLHLVEAFAYNPGYTSGYLFASFSPLVGGLLLLYWAERRGGPELTKKE